VNVEISVTDEAIGWLASRGFDKLYGARPMSRLMQTTVKKRLVDAVLFGPLAAGGTAMVDVADGEIVVDCSS
jgi:ATP-dependent Clp protease ATP-binding subunit ClpA